MLRRGLTKTQELSNFSQRSKEVRDLAIEVRNQCKELEPEMKLNYEMSGIQIFDLNGDGARDIFVDNEELCGGLRLAGGNCSNRGCDDNLQRDIQKVGAEKYSMSTFMLNSWLLMGKQAGFS